MESAGQYKKRRVASDESKCAKQKIIQSDESSALMASDAAMSDYEALRIDNIKRNQGR